MSRHQGSRQILPCRVRKFDMTGKFSHPSRSTRNSTNWFPRTLAMQWTLGHSIGLFPVANITPKPGEWISVSCNCVGKAPKTSPSAPSQRSDCHRLEEPSYAAFSFDRPRPATRSALPLRVSQWTCVSRRRPKVSFSQDFVSCWRPERVSACDRRLPIRRIRCGPSVNQLTDRGLTWNQLNHTNLAN